MDVLNLPLLKNSYILLYIIEIHYMHQLGRCLENIQWKPFLDLAVSVINFDRFSLVYGVYGMWINFCSIIFVVKKFLHIYWIYFKIRFTKNALKIKTLALCLCDSDTGCPILKRAFWKCYKTNNFCEDTCWFSYFSKKNQRGAHWSF